MPGRTPLPPLTREAIEEDWRRGRFGLASSKLAALAGADDPLDARPGSEGAHAGEPHPTEEEEARVLIAVSSLPRTSASRFTRRRVLVAFAILVLCAGAWAALRARRPIATASTEMLPRLGAANAIDGDIGSEWVPPNGAGGTLVIRFPGPVTTTRLRILNGDNRGFPPRAIERCRIEVLLEGGESRVFEQVFPAYVRKPPWTEIPLGARVRVESIRVVVESWHGAGPALAEVEW